MYLYATNVAIDEGKQQPVHFKLNQPLRLTDVNGVEWIVRFIEMIGSVGAAGIRTSGPQREGWNEPADERQHGLHGSSGKHKAIKWSERWLASLELALFGVTCQERTREELMDTLAITLAEILEIRREAAQSAAEDGYETATISVV